MATTIPPPPSGLSRARSRGLKKKLSRGLHNNSRPNLRSFSPPDDHSDGCDDVSFPSSRQSNSAGSRGRRSVKSGVDLIGLLGSESVGGCQSLSTAREPSRHVSIASLRATNFTAAPSGVKNGEVKRRSSLPTDSKRGSLHRGSQSLRSLRKSLHNSSHGSGHLEDIIDTPPISIRTGGQELDISGHSFASFACSEATMDSSYNTAAFFAELTDESKQPGLVELGPDSQSTFTTHTEDVQHVFEGSYRTLENVTGKAELMGKHPSQHSDHTMEMEVAPGVYLPFRGPKETWRALDNGTALETACMDCSVVLISVPDCENVVCPDCHMVNPIFDHAKGTTPFGVGIGLKKDWATSR
ncbi:expressed unknown protein [Seminavis robusta]|uniref:Uncharacterized protein n=1 Tax=Seminavis robusta TaxID=568900 RepID=A0A9N8DPQ6_9STRA|nr:expressed unknown protein [Seminavis robusta]|eukprot:Sro198_g084070.1 n/a (355) ;mRNA; r:43096-44160